MRLVHQELHQVNLNGSVFISLVLPHWHGHISQSMLAGGSVLGRDCGLESERVEVFQIHPVSI